MSITISAAPANPALVGNQVVIKCSTDKMVLTAGSKADCSLEFTTTSNGQIFALSYGNEVLTFEFKTTPDDSGFQMPLITSDPTFLTFVTAFANNYYINRDWDLTTVSTVSPYEILLTAKENGTEYSVTVSPAFGLAGHSETAGVDDVFAENMKPFAEIYIQYPDTSDFFLAATVDASPDSSGDFEVYLDEILLRYWPVTPPGVYYPDLGGLDHFMPEKPELLLKYYVRIYERYGNPATNKKATLLGSSASPKMAFGHKLSYAAFLRNRQIAAKSVVTIFGISTTLDVIMSLGSTVLCSASTIASDTQTSVAHGLINGDRVYLSNLGTVTGTGLAVGSLYYIVEKTADTFKLSLTLGGAAINLTGADTTPITYRQVLPHTLADGDPVIFTAMTGGTGFALNTLYYVINVSSANGEGHTFQLSLTLGGAAINFSSDITAGTITGAGALETFFTNTNHDFITARTSKRLSPTQQDYLLWYTPAVASGSDNLNFEMDIYYKDGSAPDTGLAPGLVNITPFPGAGATIWMFVVDVNYIQTLTSGKRISKVLIGAHRAWDNPSGGDSNIITYEIDYNTYEFNNYLLYLSSCGSWEVFWFTGPLQPVSKFESIEAVVSRASTTTAQDREVFNYNHQYTDWFEIGTGLKATTELNQLKELMNSREVFILDGSFGSSTAVWRPIEMDRSKELELAGEMEEMFTRVVRFRNAYDEV